MDKFQFDLVLSAMADKVFDLTDRVRLQGADLNRLNEENADLHDKVRDLEEQVCGHQRTIKDLESAPIRVTPVQEGATMIDTAHVLWTTGQTFQLQGHITGLISAVRSNQKIAAIKQARAMTGLGLKDAKDLVDSAWSSEINSAFR